MRPRSSTIAVGLLTLAAVLPSSAHAELNFDLGGFAQANYGARVTDAGCAGTVCDFMLGEERLQLKLEATTEDGRASFKGKVDLLHDAVFNQVSVDLREVYLDLVWKYVTLRAGRQILTWGVGDLLFVNDLFPRDWVAFFAGRPLQYLKVGSDAIKIGIHPRFLKLEVAVMPFFAPDNTPSGQRLLLPTSSAIPSGLPVEVEQKQRSVRNIELAGKLSTYIRDWELAAYVARTFYRSPAFGVDDPAAPTRIIASYPRLNSYGASVAGSLLGGVLTVEAAYYDSEEDRDGTSAAIENSQVRGLLGYSHPLWKDATLGVQGYVEFMTKHAEYEASLPANAYTRDAVRGVATLRFRQLLLHQTLTLNLFAYYGISEQDAYIIPSVRYSFADGFWGELGANIFVGKEDESFFGVVKDNTNIYVTARYSF